MKPIIAEITTTRIARPVLSKSRAWRVPTTTAAKVQKNAAVGNSQPITGTKANMDNTPGV